MNMLRFYFIWKDFGNVVYIVHRTLQRLRAKFGGRVYDDALHNTSSFCLFMITSISSSKPA